MKKRFLLLVSLAVSLMSLYFISCSRDVIDVNEDANEFVKEARAFFESNSADIQAVRVGDVSKPVVSRGMNLSSRVIHPDWNEPVYFKQGKITSIEIPLQGDVFTNSLFSKKMENGTFQRTMTNVRMKLIVQKHDVTGNFRSFIVTLVGDEEYEKKSRTVSKKYSFFENTDFSGMMIISDLSGNYLEAYMYGNGVRERVILARAAGFKEINPVEACAGFSLMDAQGAGMYARGAEGGGGGSTWPGGGGGVVIPPGGGGSYCALCLKANCDGRCEVVVTYCRKCSRPADNCGCCSVCHDYPCSCPLVPPTPEPEWQCPFCGSYYCPGSCRPTGGGGTNIPSASSNVSAIFKKQSLGNDITKLNEIFEELLKDCAYKAMFNYLKTKPAFDDVIFDPNLGGTGIYAGANAAASATRLKFRDRNSITVENVAHEMYHMYQNRYGSIADLERTRNMVEYEGKLYRDITTYVRYGGNKEALEKSGHQWLCVNTFSVENQDKYLTWLNKITSGGAKFNGVAITREDFYYWADKYGDVDIVYNKDRGWDYTVDYGMTVGFLLNKAQNDCGK